MLDRSPRPLSSPGLGVGLKIGYVVPEFPGQTHVFFWREIQRLEQAGVVVDLISTRKPPQGLRSHLWSSEVQQRTTYLMERKLKTVVRTVWDNIRLPRRQGQSGLGLLDSGQVKSSRRWEDVACFVIGTSLARLAKNRSWDHIHVHSCANAAEIVMFAAEIAQVPYSLTLHGPLRDYGPHQQSKWQGAAFGITITRNLLKEIRNDLGDAIAAKTVIVPMGVSLDKYRREVPYSPWPGSGPAQLISVGRLNPCKGHDDLIKAVGCLRDRKMDVRLCIAGEDEQGGLGYRKALQALIDDLSLGDHVHLLGAIDEKEIRRRLSESHLFVLASHHEPLGVAIMEAMALDLPVLVAAGGGVAELVEDQVDGVIFHDRHPKKIADSIYNLLATPSLAQRLSAVARFKIERSFSDVRSAEVLILQILDCRSSAVSK